jgi:hypothetical protein
MKQFIVAIFLCVAFTALLDAGQRKIAYERGEKIFVADVDDTHSRKVADGALPEISPDSARVAFNTEGDAKNRPGPERHIAIADVASGQVTVLQIFRATTVSVRSGRRMENSSLFQLWQTRRGNSVW